MASTCVGLTLPGIIELPGSFAGITSSPIPQRGPDDRNRISFAILWMLVARFVKVEWYWVRGSLKESAWNLFTHGAKFGLGSVWSGHGGRSSDKQVKKSLFS